MATREEIDNLKRQWAADPHWDIEETEGFEEHKEELLAYHTEIEQQGHRRHMERVWAKAAAVGCETNYALGEYLLLLERRISDLERRLNESEGM